MLLKHIILSLMLSLGLISCHSKSISSSQRCLSETNKTLIQEFLRLSELYGPELWSNWSNYPTAILLVEDRYEFLIGHKIKPKGFKEACEIDENFQTYYRKRVLPKRMLASFPAFSEQPVIVIGTVENTGVKNSTDWISVLFHERFHQIQFSQKDYYKKVDSIKPNGSKDASWMLTYPFPYKDESINLVLKIMGEKLYDAVNNKNLKSYESYKVLKAKLSSLLSKKDFFYMQFQIWQEGVARYSEIKSLEKIKNKFSSEFKSTNGFNKNSNILDYKKKSLKKDIKSLNLIKLKRTLFYTLGYYEAEALDLFDSNWKQRYFKTDMLNMN